MTSWGRGQRAAHGCAGPSPHPRTRHAVTGNLSVLVGIHVRAWTSSKPGARNLPVRRTWMARVGYSIKIDWAGPATPWPLTADTLMSATGRSSVTSTSKLTSPRSPRGSKVQASSSKGTDSGAVEMTTASTLGMMEGRRDAAGGGRRHVASVEPLGWGSDHADFIRAGMAVRSLCR